MKKKINFEQTGMEYILLVRQSIPDKLKNTLPRFIIMAHRPKFGRVATKNKEDVVLIVGGTQTYEEAENRIKEIRLAPGIQENVIFVIVENNKPYILQSSVEMGDLSTIRDVSSNPIPNIALEAREHQEGVRVFQAVQRQHALEEEAVGIEAPDLHQIPIKDSYAAHAEICKSVSLQRAAVCAYFRQAETKMEAEFQKAFYSGEVQSKTEEYMRNANIHGTPITPLSVQLQKSDYGDEDEEEEEASSSQRPYKYY